VVAALALAVAVAVVSSPPRRRLAARNRPGAGVIGAGGVLGCAVLGASVVTARPAPTVVAATAVVAVTVAVRDRRRRYRRRGREQSRALETALDLLVAELRVGAHPVRAFSVAAAETGEATVGAALRAVAARSRLGADVSAGLRGVSADSVLGAHWERLAVCWQLASEHGLAMSVLMRAAQRDIAERQRISARVAAGMAGARATALVLSCLPVLGVLLGQLIGAAPLGFLFGQHAGGWMLMAGVTLTCGGLLWSDRITGMVGR
jgi:tight adherence protein B